MNNLEDGSITIQAPVTIPLERLADTLSCALDGGSGYWCRKCRVNWNHLSDVRTLDIWAGEAIALGADFKIWHEEDDDDLPTDITVNDQHWQQTLVKLANDYPAHFADMIAENEDAETGDVLFQLLCFGEVVYG